MNVAENGTGVGSFGDIGTDTRTANETIVSQAHPRSLEDSLYRTIYSGQESDLKDYLERPQLMATGLFANTDLPTTFAKFKVIDDLYSKALLYNKILGRYAFKADVRVRLQANATRFQQGRYILAWIPSGGDNGMSGADAFNLFHAATTCQVTQLPHVEFDLNCDTEVELVIPFTSYFMAIGQVSTGVNSMDVGTWFIYPYEPLAAAAGSLSCAYSVWANFENVKFYGSAIPQSGMKMQSKKKGGLSVAQKEAISVGKGPISTVLNGISTFAGTLSMVPMLTEIAAPVSWVTGILGQTAAAFGWSKPSDESPSMRVVRQPQPFFSNVDVVDPGMKLSMSISNSINVLPGFAGTDIDEMSIDYLKSIPAFFSRFNYTTAQGVNAALCNYKVSPMHCGYLATTLSGTATTFPPVAYIANAFGYWRGSLKFTFKFVKTEFHSGRLLISFNPVNSSYNGTVAPTVISNSNYVIREIFDLRRGNEFTVTVPYVNYENWSETEGGFIGYLSALVLDPLIAPSTVSSSITCLVEVSGGDDLEFAAPSGSSAGHNLIQLTTFQSGMTMQNVEEPCEVSDIVLGGSTSMDADTVVAASFSCIGEKILSLRQYLKRFSPLSVVAGTAGSTFLLGDGVAVGYTITPLMDVNLDFAVAPKAPTYSADPFTYFGAMYGLFRGSIRYRLTNFSNSDQGTLMAAMTAGRYSKSKYWNVVTPNGAPGSVVALSRDSGFDNLAIGMVAANAGVEVTCPFYNRNHSAPVRGMLINGTTSTTTNTNLSGLATTAPEAPHTALVVALSAANSGYCFSRAIGEDASFGRFISTPVISGNRIPA